MVRLVLSEAEGWLGGWVVDPTPTLPIANYKTAMGRERRSFATLSSQPQNRDGEGDLLLPHFAFGF
jgi:hypothetical protein